MGKQQKYKLSKSTRELLYSNNVKDLRILFEKNFVEEWGVMYYTDEKTLFSNSVYSNETMNSQPSYLDSIKSIVKAIEENEDDHPVKYLIELSQDETFNGLGLLKFVQYGEAIQVFKLFDKTTSEVAKVFIVLQFFSYYLNKKDKNVDEVHAFLAKIVLDKSYLVASCFKYIKRFFKKCDFDIIHVIFSMFNNVPLLESFSKVATSSNLITLLNENMDEMFGKLDDSLKYMYRVIFEVLLIDQVKPTHESQLCLLKFLEVKFESNNLNKFIKASRN